MTNMEKSIETKITWNRPGNNPPPFGQKILVVVGGEECKDGVWKKYLKPMEVVISKSTREDELSESPEYDDVVSGKQPFANCAFFLLRNELPVRCGR